MPDLTPSDAQFKAIKQIEDWFRNQAAAGKQIFRLFGYAGTGKSTLVKIAIRELGLADEYTRVKYATFTGKAAYVLRKMGTPTAQTLHSLIYSVTEASEEEIDKAKAKLGEMETEALQFDRGSLERTLAEAGVEAMRQQIKKLKQPQFGLNPESDLVDADLLVVDEVSMVGPEMAADILSFKKPVLVLGDPGQLPPIKGEGAFTQQTPDVMLTEIHRQASESAIVRLATKARQNEPIAFGRHDDEGNVWKMHKSACDASLLLSGGAQSQVICGKNATRLELNNIMRRETAKQGAIIDPNSPIPSGPHEKVIVLKNRNDIGLINGMFCELSEIEKIDDRRFFAILKSEEGDYPAGKDVVGEYNRLRFYSGHFIDHGEFDRERLDKDWKIRKSLVEATFGWAITCHKAQGSAFDPAIIWDDGLGRTRDDRARWMYTAVTRAVEKLLILE